MEPRSRIPTVARRVALAASLAALLAPAAAQAAAAKTARSKPPVVTAVSPSKLAVGEKLTIRGRHFRSGKAKNSVIFQRPGTRAVFVKADLATTKMLTVVLPKTLERFLTVKSGEPQPTVFRVRIMASRLGKTFTSAAISPTVSPAPLKRIATPGAPAGMVAPVDPAKSASAIEDGDCDADGARNGVDADDDDDLLTDALEVANKLDACKVDTDGDGVQDGYEYRSARDLNDDESEEPDTFLPYPGKRPYPNPLDASDAKTDHDGDTLTLEEEQALWRYSTEHGSARSLDDLTYSDGTQHSIYTRRPDGRRMPTLKADGYDKQACFLAWADPTREDDCITGEVEHGYLNVMLVAPGQRWFTMGSFYDIRDFNRDGTVSDPLTATGPAPPELTYYDSDQDGYLSDDERDEDADGLGNWQETRHCLSPGLWSALYMQETPYYRKYAGTDLADEDTDGDGVRDGADDQDHDDVPNLMECSRLAASDRALDARPIDRTPKDGEAVLPIDIVGTPTPAKGFVNPFNPCLPNYASRTCDTTPPVGAEWAPFQPNVKYYLVQN